MTVHTLSSREFTRDVSAAKRAAAQGPVFITDRGRPAFALLSIEEFHRLSGYAEPTLLDVMDGIVCEPSIEFEPLPLAFASRAAGLE